MALKQQTSNKYPTYTIAEFSVDPFQTTDNTEALIGSFSVSQNQFVSVLMFEASAVNSGHTATIEANLQAAFLRGSGNVARTSNSATNGLIRNIFTSLGLTNSVSIDARANASTQAIDFYVKGDTGQTFNWNFYIKIKFENS